MPGAQTLSEKILSARCGRRANAGDIVVAEVDLALGTDASTPMALDYFAAMGGARLLTPRRVVLAFDHYAPAPNRAIAALHQRLREFAARQGVLVWDVGDGIGHQLVVESGRVTPGTLAVGADSHAVTYGALGAFATGIGSSDLAGIFLTGRIWLRVPDSIRVRLHGALPPGVAAKDAVLALARELGDDGAAYQTLEFTGDGVAALGPDGRLVFANMAVELGAKNAIFSGDLAPDPGAAYRRRIDLDLGRMEPMVALPHQVDRVVAITAAAGTPVHMAYLGTCTGGRVADFHQAAEVLKAGGGVAPGVRLVVTPASRLVLETLARDGTLADLIAWGAVLGTPGCGACCGTSGSIPGDGEAVISTANRNFHGRMGNPSASIYLASPASCAAAAVRGCITDPREVCA